MSNSAELQDQHLSFYNTIRQCCFGNFSIRFWEKTVNFQLGMGPFTGPACKGYYALPLLDKEKISIKGNVMTDLIRVIFAKRQRGKWMGATSDSIRELTVNLIGLNLIVKRKSDCKYIVFRFLHYIFEISLLKNNSHDVFLFCFFIN